MKTVHNPRRVKKIVLYLAVICLIGINALTLTASAFLDFPIDGPVGIAILVTLICLVALVIGIIIYAKYFRKTNRGR